MTLRFILIAVVFLSSVPAASHHWVRDIYDGQRRVIVEVQVQQFRLVYPHPMMLVEITALPEGQEDSELTVGQTWILEMDNRRELTALGIDAETFAPGDQLRVVVDPSFDSSYRDNTLYMRAVEHPREGFVYLHNVRQLFAIEPDEDSLSKHLSKIN